jgi:hypothetical protein
MDWLKAQAKDQYPELAQETHEIATISNAEGKDINHQVLLKYMHKGYFKKAIKFEKIGVPICLAFHKKTR